jgi:hypothetical protein
VVFRGTELPGVAQLAARNAMEYGQMVQRLLRDPKERAKQSEVVLKRFRAEFDPSLLGPRYMEFVAKVMTADAPKRERQKRDTVKRTAVIRDPCALAVSPLREILVAFGSSTPASRRAAQAAGVKISLWLAV